MIALLKRIRRWMWVAGIGSLTLCQGLRETTAGTLITWNIL